AVEMASAGPGHVGFPRHATRGGAMDPTDGRSQPPPEARGEADLAPTTEFRAFLAGDPIPTGADDDAPFPRQSRPLTRDQLAARRRARAVAAVASRPAAPAETKATRGLVRSSRR